VSLFGSKNKNRKQKAESRKQKAENRGKNEKEN
jgi:hypothetical protein